MDGRNTLRATLRRETAAQHDRLDADMGTALTGDGYGAMLVRQYRARAGIERWFAAHADAALQPPLQTGLLAADLEQLGLPVPAGAPDFDAAPGGVLGAAWAIAGSHLGNRAMATLRRKQGAHGADGFLRDTAMADYWQRLLPRLAAPAAPSASAAAVRGAQAVFAHFLGLPQAAHADADRPQARAA